jgi:hypothetical protein
MLFTLKVQKIFKEFRLIFLIFIIKTTMKLHLTGTYANQNLKWKRLLITLYFRINHKNFNFRSAVIWRVVGQVSPDVSKDRDA